MAKRKKIVRPQYTPKAERMKKAPKKPMPKELKYGIIFCAVALVLAVVLFAIFYNDGSLPMENGEVVLGEGNWVIANVGSTSEPKYYKVAEVDAMAGYTLNEEEIDQLSTKTYRFYADDATARMNSYYVMGVNRKADDNAQTANTNYHMFDAEMDISDLKQVTIDGEEINYFTTVTKDVEAEEGAEAAEEKQHMQQMVCYFPAARNLTVLVSLTVNIDEELPPLADAELEALLKDVAAQIRFEGK